MPYRAWRSAQTWPSSPTPSKEPSLGRGKSADGIWLETETNVEEKQGVRMYLSGVQGRPSSYLGRRYGRDRHHEGPHMAGTPQPKTCASSWSCSPGKGRRLPTISSWKPWRTRYAGWTDLPGRSDSRCGEELDAGGGRARDSDIPDISGRSNATGGLKDRNLGLLEAF